MQQKLFHKYPVYKFLPKKEAKKLFWHFLIPHMCTRHIRNNKKCLKSGICFFFLIVGDCLQSVSQADSAPSTTSFSCTGGNCLNLEVALVIDSVRFNSLTMPTFSDVSRNDRKNNPLKILCSFSFSPGFLLHKSDAYQRPRNHLVRGGQRQHRRLLGLWPGRRRRQRNHSWAVVQ